MVSILTSSILAFNIGHIRNIGLDIGRYYRVNIISDTSKPDLMLLICIVFGWYLKPCFGVYVDKGGYCMGVNWAD